MVVSEMMAGGGVLMLSTSMISREESSTVKIVVVLRLGRTRAPRSRFGLRTGAELEVLLIRLRSEVSGLLAESSTCGSPDCPLGSMGDGTGEGSCGPTHRSAGSSGSQSSTMVLGLPSDQVVMGAGTVLPLAAD
jgi:hypothetical protein